MSEENLYPEPGKKPPSNTKRRFQYLAILLILALLLATIAIHLNFNNQLPTACNPNGYLEKVLAVQSDSNSVWVLSSSVNPINIAVGGITSPSNGSVSLVKFHAGGEPAWIITFANYDFLNAYATMILLSNGIIALWIQVYNYTTSYTLSDGRSFNFTTASMMGTMTNRLVYALLYINSDGSLRQSYIFNDQIIKIYKGQMDDIFVVDDIGFFNVSHYGEYSVFRVAANFTPTQWIINEPRTSLYSINIGPNDTVVVLNEIGTSDDPVSEILMYSRYGVYLNTVYVAGNTESDHFYATDDSFVYYGGYTENITINGVRNPTSESNDIFALKLNASGSVVSQYYFGSLGLDTPYDIHWHAGSLYMIGKTDSYTMNGTFVEITKTRNFIAKLYADSAVNLYYINTPDELSVTAKYTFSDDKIYLMVYGYNPTSLNITLISINYDGTIGPTTRTDIYGENMILNGAYFAGIGLYTSVMGNSIKHPSVKVELMQLSSSLHHNWEIRYATMIQTYITC